MPAIGFCILIFVQSAFPSPEQLPSFQYSDKLLHLTAYAILAFLFCRAFNSTGRWRNRRRMVFLFGVVAATLYGMSDEWHQSFVPGRFAEIGDAMADFAGSLVGSWIYLHYLSRRSRSHTS
ncbi:MAG: VanZ family protein [Desulfobacteraceae bacterium]